MWKLCEEAWKYRFFSWYYCNYLNAIKKNKKSKIFWAFFEKKYFFSINSDNIF